MDDIAHELGMSKKTLYVVYDNKKHIVETITEKFLAHHEKEYELLVAEAKDAVDELLLLMEKRYSSLFSQLQLFCLQG